MAIVLFVPMLVIAVLIRLTSRGPILYWSRRVGINNSIFLMPKFRTMKVGVPQVATHILADPERYLTPVGAILRKFSLDELPQLYSIVMGDMSFVGPRPALFNQDDLISQRTVSGVHRMVPGLTGWAQINGRDDLAISDKVRCDQFYMRNQSFLFDLKIMFLTIFRAARADGVSH